MDVHPRHECIDEPLVLAEMCEYPQFNLGVVSGENKTSLLSDEGVPDPPSPFAPYRDVLKVGVTAAQPSCGGDGLVKRGVNAAGTGIYQVRQDICVGGL